MRARRSSLRAARAVVVGALAAALGACAGGGGQAVGDADAGPSPGDATAGANDASDGAPADGLAADGLAADGDGIDAAEAPPRLPPLACLLDAACARPMVAAHRGDHRVMPENSLAGLRAAAALGVDLVEVDVRHTADDVLVLLHDADVDRTTDGTGVVSELTWAQVQALRLTRGTDGDPESLRVPRFDEAMALARELGVMLYVDQKTGRHDLVLAAITAGAFEEVALVRSGLADVVALRALDPEGAVLVMPAIEDEADLATALAEVPGVAIVEIAKTVWDPALTAAARAAGVKVQQDVMAAGDTLVVFDGDPTGWRSFVEAGVGLLQTDLPHVLVPVLAEVEATGAWPDAVAVP